MFGYTRRGRTGYPNQCVPAAPSGVLCSAEGGGGRGCRCMIKFSHLGSKILGDTGVFAGREMMPMGGSTAASGPAALSQ